MSATTLSQKIAELKEAAYKPKPTVYGDSMLDKRKPKKSKNDPALENYVRGYTKESKIDCPQMKLEALKEKVAYYVQQTDKGNMPMPTTVEESYAINKIIERAKKRRNRKMPI